MNYVLGVAYFLVFCVVFGVGSWPSFGDRAEDLQNWTFGLAAVYWASRIAIVIGWVTLLPAWFCATKVARDTKRAAILWAGITACVLPVWTGMLGGGLGTRPAGYVLAALAIGGVLSWLLAKLPWKVSNHF